MRPANYSVPTPPFAIPLSHTFIRRLQAGSMLSPPYTSVVAAHNALTSYNGLSNGRASRFMENFMEAKRIHWYSEMNGEVVCDGFSLARELNIGGWDSHCAQVALEEGVGTILTIDDGFERIEGVEAEVVLSSEEFAALNDYLGY